MQKGEMNLDRQNIFHVAMENSTDDKGDARTNTELRVFLLLDIKPRNKALPSIHLSAIVRNIF